MGNRKAGERVLRQCGAGGVGTAEEILYLLGILLNRQQDNAKQWRKEPWCRIRALEKSRQG